LQDNSQILCTNSEKHKQKAGGKENIENGRVKERKNGEKRGEQEKNLKRNQGRELPFNQQHLTPSSPSSSS
jgi:hypothetical protein